MVSRKQWAVILVFSLVMSVPYLASDLAVGIPYLVVAAVILYSIVDFYNRRKNPDAYSRTLPEEA